jgi:hypothetical protein
MYNHFQNLEFFDSEGFNDHLVANPCLHNPTWDSVWPALQEEGWVEEVQSEGDVLYYFPQKRHMPRDQPEELIEGIHKFKSRMALMMYIMKFPYLLQTKIAFENTIRTFNLRTTKGSDRLRVFNVKGALKG